GTFQPQRRVAVGAALGFGGWLAVGDFNGDGHDDLAGLVAPSDVAVLLGQGDGTFQDPVPYPVASGAGSVVAADFNQDGQLGLAVASVGGGSVLLGRGDGTFQDPLASVSPVGRLLAYSVTGDFNGDGIPDVATDGFLSNDVSVLLGRGDGTFE